MFSVFSARHFEPRQDTTKRIESCFGLTRYVYVHSGKGHFVPECCGKGQLLPCDSHGVCAVLAILRCFVYIHICVSVDSALVHKEVLMHLQDG